MSVAHDAPRYSTYHPSGKSKTQPVLPPLQFLPLRMLQASSLTHLLQRFWQRHPIDCIAFRYLLSLTEPKLSRLSNSSLDGIGFTRWRIIISAGRMPGLYASPLMVNSSLLIYSYACSFFIEFF